MLRFDGALFMLLCYELKYGYCRYVYKFRLGSVD